MVQNYTCEDAVGSSSHVFAKIPSKMWYFANPRIETMPNRTLSLPLFAAAALLLATSVTSAQDAPPATDIRYCGQWMMEEAFFNAHPGAREAAEEADQRLEEEIQALEDFNRDELIIIPVVFHVIHYN